MLNGLTSDCLRQVHTLFPVWQALSGFFLDTELREDDLIRIATVLAESPYSEDKIEEILRFEVTPVCKWNILNVAGEWAGFDDGWLREKIAPRIDARPWLRWSVSGMIRQDCRRPKIKVQALRARER